MSRDAVVRATIERLGDSSRGPGQEPDDYYSWRRLSRSECDKMREHISYRWFKGICLRLEGFTSVYNKDINLLSRRGTRPHLRDRPEAEYNESHVLDDLSSDDKAKGAIAGRGMAAETSTCYNNCGKQGQYARM